MRPPPLIQDPVAGHTHTVILLHGRGSDGSQFWRAIRRMRPSLFAEFPSFRWVFPSSHDGNQWFESPTSQQDLEVDKIPGLDKSIRYVLEVIQDEVQRLGGRWDRLVLGGLSQGHATALHVLLCCNHRLGAYFGASGYLPLAHKLQGMDVHAASVYLRNDLDQHDDQVVNDGDDQVGGTPVFLGHGTHDRKVPLPLAIQARDVLSGSMKMDVTWRQYVGPKLEGHWIKEPEELEDIAQFLHAKLNLGNDNTKDNTVHSFD